MSQGFTGYPSQITKQQVQHSAFNIGVDSGAADSYVVACTPPITTLTNGLTVTFTPLNSNVTTTPIIDVGTGTLSIFGKAYSQVGAYDIYSSIPCTIMYNSSGISWQLVNPQYVGYYVSANVLAGSAISLTNGAGADVCYIDLFPGDWEISGSVFFTADSTTLTTYAIGGISQTSGTFETAGTNNNNAGLSVIGGTAIQALSPNQCIASYRALLTSTTRIYLIAQSGFTVSTMTAYGYIGARRV